MDIICSTHMVCSKWNNELYNSINLLKWQSALEWDYTPITFFHSLSPKNQTGDKNSATTVFVIKFYINYLCLVKELFLIYRNSSALSEYCSSAWHQLDIYPHITTKLINYILLRNYILLTGKIFLILFWQSNNHFG